MHKLNSYFGLISVVNSWVVGYMPQNSKGIIIIMVILHGISLTLQEEQADCTIHCKSVRTALECTCILEHTSAFNTLNSWIIVFIRLVLEEEETFSFTTTADEWTATCGCCPEHYCHHSWQSQWVSIHCLAPGTCSILLLRANNCIFCQHYLTVIGFDSHFYQLDEQAAPHQLAFGTHTYCF